MNCSRRWTLRLLAYRPTLILAAAWLVGYSGWLQGGAANAQGGRSVSLSAYQCGGRIEDSVWNHWEKTGRAHLADKLLGARLAAQGDTYALYDLEIIFHNLLAMAQRCRRVDRQLEFAELVKVAFAQLGPASAPSEGVAWICRGGAICNRKNRLLDTEVVLNSVQFLAFVSSIAVELQSAPSAVRAAAFKAQTAEVVHWHLKRWNDFSARMALRKRIGASPADIKNAASTLFLTDTDLWMLAVYADFAGLVEQQPVLRRNLGLDVERLSVMGEHVALLLRLFHARTTKMVATDKSGARLTLADIDVGFWGRYFDNRYAGYTISAPPIRCVTDPDDSTRRKMEVLVDPATIPLVNGLGWDFSHARRFVHFFDAMERNRLAMARVYGLTLSDIPSAELAAAFARQLQLKVWNQSMEHPLFANYLSGVNGWYRVAYDNGTGQCREGFPPFGLSDSFPTGGYATWARFEPVIGVVAQRIYAISTSAYADDKLFIDGFYRTLGSQVAPVVRELNELMFWPSLIGNL